MRAARGGRIRAIGEVPISRSPASQRKNRRRAKSRWQALFGRHRATWSTMNASTCSRRIASGSVAAPAEEYAFFFNDEHSGHPEVGERRDYRWSMAIVGIPGIYLAR